MDGILKWCEKNHKEAEKYFKNDLKDYFFEVKREARNYNLDDIKFGFSSFVIPAKAGIY